MGVAITKLHPLPHPHVAKSAHSNSGDHIPNFSLISRLISFWHTKQLPVVVAMTKPQPFTHIMSHPQVVNSTHPVTWKMHTKFQSDSLVLKLDYSSLNNFCGSG